MSMGFATLFSRSIEKKTRDRPPGIDLPGLTSARMVEQDRVASVGGEIRIGEIGERLRRRDELRGVEIDQERIVIGRCDLIAKPLERDQQAAVVDEAREHRRAHRIVRGWFGTEIDAPAFGQRRRVVPTHADVVESDRQQAAVRAECG